MLIGKSGIPDFFDFVRRFYDNSFWSDMKKYSRTCSLIDHWKWRMTGVISLQTILLLVWTTAASLERRQVIVSQCFMSFGPEQSHIFQWCITRTCSECVLFYIFLKYIHSNPTKHRYSISQYSFIFFVLTRLSVSRCVDVLRTQRIYGMKCNDFFKIVMPLARNWDGARSHLLGRSLGSYEPLSVLSIWHDCHMGYNMLPSSEKSRLDICEKYMLWPLYFPLLCCLSGSYLSWTNCVCKRSYCLRCTYLRGTYHLHPQFDWEMNIGDGHFATCHHFFTPEQKVGGRALSPIEDTWNEWLQLPRSRIEHLNSVIKSHAMFSGEPYRGWVQNLKAFVNISLNGAALQMLISGSEEIDMLVFVLVPMALETFIIALKK